mmetsp:Transcript_38873/g.103242  ORF Transcript_38873/g.103242 Transcript_38873/m.103242 type:complete len:254 (+) Transcript_38873:613-1374(+)
MHLVIMRVGGIRQRKVQLPVIRQVIHEVEGRPGQERSPRGRRVETQRRPDEPLAKHEDQKPVELLEGVLVSSVTISTEGHEIPVMLLVTVGIQGTEVGHTVERVVDEVVQNHQCHEGHGSIYHAQCSKRPLVAQEHRENVVHADELAESVERQVGQIDPLQNFQLSLFTGSVHSWSLQKTLQNHSEDVVQKKPAWHREHIREDVDIHVKQPRGVQCPRQPSRAIGRFAPHGDTCKTDNERQCHSGAPHIELRL